jgi:K+-transporting ATPase ATPase A chain
MKMAVIAILAPPMALLLGSAVAVILPSSLASLSNSGPHGLSEIIYAFTSAANNNGSAFAGLNANTPFYNILLALAMLIGRFAVIVPVLVIAGSLAKKKVVPPGPGTFPTTGPTFSLLLASIVVMVGALTFFPALALGPIVEHLLMYNAKLF